MNKDEALRLALEALKESLYATTAKSQHLAFEAITAIKAALEAKDEPVAWRDAAIRLGEELSSVGPNGYYDMDAEQWLDWAMEQNPRGKHSLPQRTWVGLTDEEKQEWIDAMPYDPEPRHCMILVNVIEAKLKDKNHA